MKRELQEKLINKYADMFGHILHPAEGPIVPIRFGIECADGWYMLLDELMSEIKNHLDNEKRNAGRRIKSGFWRDVIKHLEHSVRHGSKFKREIVRKIAGLFKHEDTPIADITITQIKEKFGGLRFYYDGGDDTIDGMVCLAESLSYRICEECGTTINVGQTQGWIVTCCKPCFDAGKTNQNTWKPNKE